MGAGGADVANDACTKQTGGRALTRRSGGWTDRDHEAQMGGRAEEVQTGPRRRGQADGRSDGRADEQTGRLGAE